MSKQGQYTLLNHPLRNHGQVMRQSRLAKNHSQSQRLIYPIGRNNYNYGVQKQSYQTTLPYSKVYNYASLSNPQSTIRRSISQRNILSVADIQGASPSVAPEKVRNILRAKQHLRQNEMANQDYLGHYERLFKLKQINNSQQSNGIQKVIQSNSERVPRQRFNPTYITTFMMHH